MEDERPLMRWWLTTAGAVGGLLAGAMVGASCGSHIVLPLFWALFGGSIGYVLDEGTWTQNLLWPVLMAIGLSVGGLMSWAIVCIILWAGGDSTRSDHYLRTDIICHAGGHIFPAGFISAFLWAIVENLKRLRSRMPLPAYLPGLLTCCPLLVLSCCLMTWEAFMPYEPHRYPSFAPDTAASFGDGRFQICRGSPGDGYGKVLSDGETQKTLLTNVEDWRENGDWAYVVGKDGVKMRPSGDLGEVVYEPGTTNQYVVLNWRTGRWTKYRRLVDVPPPHREQVRQLQTQ
jgi:hypothetical protein